MYTKNQIINQKIADSLDEIIFKYNQRQESQLQNISDNHMFFRESILKILDDKTANKSLKRLDSTRKKLLLDNPAFK